VLFRSRDPIHMSLRAPIIAITLGDPSGVGPEIAVKALAESRRELAGNSQLTAILVGDRRIIERARTHFGPDLETREIADPTEAIGSDCAYVYDVQSEHVDVDDPVSSQGTAAAGAAAYDALRAATLLALAGEVDAVVTAPLNK